MLIYIKGIGISMIVWEGGAGQIKCIAMERRKSRISGVNQNGKKTEQLCCQPGATQRPYGPSSSSISISPENNNNNNNNKPRLCSNAARIK